MSEAKFTPGPWHPTYNKKFGWWSVCHSAWCEKGETSIVVRVEDYQDEPKKTANAHLIASAPSMYDALELAESALFGCDARPDVIETVREVLAEARGESDG